MAEVDYDVAIVGFGPTGAVLAGLLGGAGLRIYVCDLSHEVYDKPRAIALDHEILRVFQQLDILEEVAPHYEPFTDSYFLGMDGKPIKRMTMVDKPYPQTFVPSAVFSQPPVETAIRKRVNSLSTVTVQTGVTVTKVAQDSQKASLSVSDEQGLEQKVTARYVVGCDGATSTIRKQSALQLEDLDFDEPWLVVDFKANEAGLEALPKTSVQYCEPDRPCTFVIGPGNHRRWEISLNAGESPTYMATPEGAWSLLERWVTPAHGELWRQASYRFHALVAEQWQNGRIFIAGDAAHQQPPFLGQGMCQGVRDASNLAWKLTMVLTKSLPEQAATQLLNSYSEERKGHVRALTTKLKSLGSVICERNEDKALARDQALREEQNGDIKPVPRQDILPPLTHGLISQTSASGSLFPQPWLRIGEQATRMDDQFGRGWRLIARNKDISIDAILAQRLDIQTLHVCEGELIETEGVLQNWFEKHNVCAALVRPDHYVYGTASTQLEVNTLSKDLLAYFSA